MLHAAFAGGTKWGIQLEPARTDLLMLVASQTISLGMIPPRVYRMNGIGMALLGKGLLAPRCGG